MAGEQHFYVYVLQSLRDRKHYIGLTADFDRRISEHNAGDVTSTKSRRPFVLIYHEKFKTRAEAHQRELYFKSAAGRRWLKKHIPCVQRGGSPPDRTC